MFQNFAVVFLVFWFCCCVSFVVVFPNFSMCICLCCPLFVCFLHCIVLCCFVVVLLLCFRILLLCLGFVVFPNFRTRFRFRCPLFVGLFVLVIVLRYFVLFCLTVLQNFAVVLLVFRFCCCCVSFVIEHLDLVSYSQIFGRVFGFAVLCFFGCLRHCVVLLRCGFILFQNCFCHCVALFCFV